MSLLTTLLAFAVTLGILITIHEFGHFYVARLCGVKILRFSIGFGKPLFTWKFKKDPDQTEWAVSALPLGGYVRMLDEKDADCQPIAQDEIHRAFNRRPVWQRFLIVLAGPASNLLLAIALYACVFMTGVTDLLPVVAQPAQGTPAAHAGLLRGDRVHKVDGKAVGTFSELRMALLDAAGDSVLLDVESPAGHQTQKQLDLKGVSLDDVSETKDPLDDLGLKIFVGQPRIAGFTADSVAQAAGLKEGDELLAVDGHKVATPRDFVNAVRKAAGAAVRLEVKTPEGATKEVSLQPKMVETAEGRVPQIGVRIAADLAKTEIRYGPLESIWQGAVKTVDTAIFSLKMIGRMIIGQASLKNISGPVTIADYAGQTARIGLEAFVSFLALVSISLGVLNLLPIPILDGGHLLYYSIEIVRGKPVSETIQALAQKAGVAVLCGLMALALFNDLTRLLQ